MTVNSPTRSTIKQAEQEWFNYNEYLKEIADLRQGILNPYDAFPDENMGGGANSERDISDPTADMATRWYGDEGLGWWEGKARRIAMLDRDLWDEHNNLGRLRYWRRNNELTWDRSAMRLKISKRQAMRWRDEIMKKTIEKI